MTVKCACVVIVNKNNCVFVDKRGEKSSLTGFWEFPGGKIDEGESSLDAAIREVKEEINIDINHDKIEFLVNYIPESKRISLDFYITKEWIGDIKLLAGQQEFTWCHVNDLKKLQMPEGNKIILPKINEYLNKF